MRMRRPAQNHRTATRRTPTARARGTAATDLTAARRPTTRYTEKLDPRPEES